MPNSPVYFTTIINREIFLRVHDYSPVWEWDRWEIANYFQALAQRMNKENPDMYTWRAMYVCDTCFEREIRQVCEHRVQFLPIFNAEQ